MVHTSSKSTATSVFKFAFASSRQMHILRQGKRKSIGHGPRENLAKCLTKEAESHITEAATISNDYVLLGKISGVDMITREA